MAVIQTLPKKEINYEPKMRELIKEFSDIRPALLDFARRW